MHEHDWIRLGERLPSINDVDSVGDVLFLRSGIATLGRLAQGIPIDATHWKHTRRYDYCHHIKDTT
jgi:hypothetical protein